MVQNNLFIKQKKNEIFLNQIYGYLRGNRETNKLGGWVCHIHTIIYKVDK